MKKQLFFLILLLFCGGSGFGQKQSWAHFVGTTGFEYAQDLCVDSNQNVYTIGFNYEGATFMDSTNVGRGHFIMKQNANGELVWIRTINTYWGLQDSKIIIDSKQENIYIAGSFMDSLYTPDDTLLARAGYFNYCLFRYDTAGNYIWSMASDSMPTFGNNSIIDIIPDSSGNIIVAAEFGGNKVTFFDTTLTPGGYIVSKIDGNGNIIWLHNNPVDYLMLTNKSYYFEVFDGVITKKDTMGMEISNIAISETIHKIKMDNNENIYIEKDEDFIAKYNNIGEFEWDYYIPVENSGIRICDFSVNKSGNMIVAYRPDDGNINYDPISLLKINNQGNYLGEKLIGTRIDETTTAKSTIRSLIYLDNEAVYYCGDGGSTASGSSTLVYGTDIINCFGNFDALVGKMDAGVINGVRNKQNAASTLNLYPNPFSNTIVVEGFSEANQHLVVIHLYSLSGQLINSYQTTNTSIEINNLNTLNNGLYYLAVISNTKTETLKIVKQ